MHLGARRRRRARLRACTVAAARAHAERVFPPFDLHILFFIIFRTKGSAPCVDYDAHAPPPARGYLDKDAPPFAHARPVYVVRIRVGFNSYIIHSCTHIVCTYGPA